MGILRLILNVIWLVLFGMRQSRLRRGFMEP